jgi:hypothetical protein
MNYVVVCIQIESDLKNIDFSDDEVEMYILDCRKAITLRSENLAVLIMNRERVCVCGLNVLNKKIFEVLHLTGRIKQFETVEEAIAYCEE